MMSERRHSNASFGINRRFGSVVVVFCVMMLSVLFSLPRERSKLFGFVT
jgi:hypothetical protein